MNTSKPHAEPDIGYHPGETAANNVISFLENIAADAPERIALYWLPQKQCQPVTEGHTPELNHASMTYRELAERVTKAARGLRDLGITRGDRVFIFVPMSPALYIAMFAVQRVGAIAVFLDSWARAGQLRACAELVNAKAMIAPEPAFLHANTLPNLNIPPLRIVTGPHKQAYDASLDHMATHSETIPICPVNGNDTALITFTTGSSGTPKGADRTHRFLAAQHHAITWELPYSTDDIDLPVFPIFSLNNMAGGVTTVLPAIDLARPSPGDGLTLRRQIEALGVTCCTLSPSLLRGLAATSETFSVPISTLRRVATGGAPISSNDIQAFNRAAPETRIIILYGSTEVEPIAHLDANHMPSEETGEGVCVGTLCDALQGKLITIHRDPIRLDERTLAQWEVPQGHVGELIVSGEHVCRNYYRNPEAFKATKIVESDGTLWHRTGDLCRYDREGRLWIVGRLHNAICREGTLLFPVKAEVLMRRLPFVEAAAYIGLPDEHLGERAVAVFSRNAAHAEANPDELVEKTLATAGIPVDDVREVDRIPLDPRHNSKVEYTTLRRQLIDR